MKKIKFSAADWSYIAKSGLTPYKIFAVGEGVFGMAQRPRAEAQVGFGISETLIPLQRQNNAPRQ